MKNLLKSLPLIALFIGSTVAFATANHPKKDTARLYYYNGIWNNNAPINLDCTEKPLHPNEICSAIFDVMNLPQDGDPEADGLSPTGVVNGEYQ